MNGVVNSGETGWLKQFTAWFEKFLIAIAEARIPPSKMTLVPKQGIVNLLTSGLGILLYTAAGHITATGRNLALASQIALVVIGAALLFAAAIVVLFVSRRSANVVDDWNRTASIFIIVWLLALVVYLLFTYPLLLITSNYILIDHLAYGIDDFLFSEPVPWRADLIKSFICTFFAGLFLIYRTKLTDREFSLLSIEPWIWLALMTVVVGFVFFVSLFKLSAG